LIGAGLLSTGCVGVLGAGTAVVLVGAGFLAYTCYDRVSVTVTDRLTGAKLCDAKVTFIQGDSQTVAASCYEAALSKGKYRLRVERAGLAPFEEEIEVVRGESCGKSVQTMFVALDRLNQPQPPQQIAPPRAAPPAAPPPPAPTPPPAATEPVPPAAAGAPAVAPSAVPAASATPAPVSVPSGGSSNGAFPQ